MGWREEFGPDYRVPKAIEALVKQGLFKDTSWHLDTSPSFSSRLVKGWLRIWVEHPDPLLRIGPKRYAVEVTKNLNIPGRILIEDDDLGQVMPTIKANAETLDYRKYWRLLE